MKSLWVLGVLAGIGGVGVVHAQSNVTIYGVIDEGFNYTNNVNGVSNYELQSGYVQGSRFGLRGFEDLGDGTKAIFRLENGFNINNGKLGQGGRMFGRSAYVGLSDNKFGTLTLGRQYDSVVDFVGPLTANGNWAGYMFSHPFDNDNTDNSFRVNNSVKYQSPDLAGFQFGGLYGASNQVGGFSNNRVMSLGANYANGPLTFGAAYMNVDNPASPGNSGGAVSGGDGSFVAERQRIFGAGVNYVYGPATFGFVYTNTNLSRPTASLYVSGSIGAPSSIKFNNFELNVKYQVSPMLFLGAMFLHTEATYTASKQSHPRWNEVALMADYNLSKRTDVYVQGAYQRVSGDTTGAPGLDNAYIPGADDSSSNRSQSIVRIGLRHKF